MPNLLERVRIVLCRPSHPGNIGSAARAMKNMGLADLRLVAPQRYPAPEAEWLATSAVDVLEAARVHATLGEAIGDCVAAYALSARPREWSPQALAVREAAGAGLARAADGPVAFVFGNETAGLTNDEMFACQTLVHIPADLPTPRSTWRRRCRSCATSCAWRWARRCRRCAAKSRPRPRTWRGSTLISSRPRRKPASWRPARSCASGGGVCFARSGARARGGEHPARPAQGPAEETIVDIGQ